MKKIQVCILSIFLIHCSYGQPDTTAIYYSPVTMPAFLQNNYYGLFDTKLLAADLAGLLTKATGKSFVPAVYKPGSKDGIFLILDSNKRSLGNETGLFETDGKKFIRITSGYTTGISYAMYSWLEQLGFHFYLPGEAWSVIPDLKTIYGNKKNKKIFKPFFRVRMFGASGGIFAVKGLDETSENEKDWRQWYLRNRMGCDYLRIDGHIGEAFNIANRKAIENDTLMIAPVKGKRVYSEGSKLDPTYKKGVDMFSSWIVDQFKKEKAMMPAFLPFKKYYSAEPADGLNYCHTAACEKQFKSISDQLFSITNEAARKIKMVDPLAGVSKMAYGESADTPGIRIEENVHIVVVPNSFQTTSTAADLLQRWARKSNNVSLYDYLNIGVGFYDKPFFNMYQYHHNLAFLKSLKIAGISFETSLSKFASGIQQYFILKYLCSPYQSVELVLDDFCKNNFRQAASPVKKLLKEWYFSDVHMKTNYDYPSFYEDELGRFIQYIMEAENKTGLDEAVKKRIGELKAYTVYLCKYYELFCELKSLQEFTVTPLLRNEKTEDILTYTWKLYHTKIFHNTQLSDMLKRTLPKEQQEKWNYYSSDHFNGISNDVSLTVKNEFEKMKAKFLPLATPVYPVTDAFMAANVKNSADSIRISSIDETALGSFNYPITFFCSKPGKLTVSYRTDSSKALKKTGHVAIISVESDDYKFIKTNVIYKENSKGIIIYQLPSKGHYRLYLSQYNATHVSYVIYPGANLFYHNKKSILMNALLMQDQENYPNKYLAIYAPTADSLFFSNLYIGSGNTSRLYSATGKPIKVNATTQAFYNAAAVPKGQKNNFLFYENSLYRWPPILKNTAPYYFFLKYPLR